MFQKNFNYIVGIIGLGYVGLPLLLASKKKYKTLGFDISKTRVNSLKKNKDIYREFNEKTLKENKLFQILYNSIDSLKQCNFFIVTVPTPIKKNKKPDLGPIKKATKVISSIIKKGDIVVYESTVFPGLSNKLAKMYFEKKNFKINEDYYLGYSPERINVGKESLKLEEITKITSGSNEFSSNIINEFYKSIINSGTHLTESIEIAESAKVIENIQRDVNIALMNELKIYFDEKNIDFKKVLNAAKTKWNFIDFKPGLVGGHCISVDPYYLINDAKNFSNSLNLTKLARQINESFLNYSNKRLKKLLDHNKSTNHKILFLGSTFKEDVSDFRNSKNYELIKKFIKSSKCKNYLYEPYFRNDIDKPENLKVFKSLNSINTKFDTIILIVNHSIFKNFFNKINNYKETNGKLIKLIF